MVNLVVLVESITRDAGAVYSQKTHHSTRWWNFFEYFSRRLCSSYNALYGKANFKELGSPNKDLRTVIRLHLNHLTRLLYQKISGCFKVFEILKDKFDFSLG